MTDYSRSLAVFIDFENLALGFHGGNGSGAKRRAVKGETFHMDRVLERLVEKGKLLAKVAYADWGRFESYRSGMHDLGIQMREIPERGVTGKNYADIQLCVDAMDLCYSKEHIDTFVVVSGDSDFTPLVSKLKENGKTVIGVGMKDSTSDLLASSCDEFIYYEDIGTGAAMPDLGKADIPKTKKKAFNLLVDSIQALQRENKDVMLASLVKDTMKRKNPSFNESAYGYRSFSNLLTDAEATGIITLRIDQRSGTYVVEGFADK